MNYTLNYNPYEFGKRIKSIRVSNKMTQEQLAEALMVSVDSVANYENGRTNCMHDHIIHICELFSVTADYLYFGKVSDEKGEKSNINVVVEKLSKIDNNEIDKIIKVLDIWY